MEEKIELFEIDHPILDGPLGIIRKSMEIPNDELPLIVELRNRVYDSFNEYVLSLVTELDDEEMIETCEKLQSSESAEDFLNILEKALNKKSSEIIEGYLKHFN